MTIAVDWPPRAVTVEQSDLTPTADPDVFDFDLDDFHRRLRVLEGSEEGIIYPRTHNFAPAVTVGTVQLAPVVEMINSYTVEFVEELSPYAANFVGANTNVADVAVVNNVSVRPNNSAGLQVVETGTSGLTPEEAVALLLATELMQADQFFDKSTGLLHYYRRGTTVDLIPPKAVAGETVLNDVTIQEP